MAEERKEPRSRTLKGGKIIIGSSGVIDCTIRDLSKSGARLKVDGALTLPEEFKPPLRRAGCPASLLPRGLEKGRAHRCRVWMMVVPRSQADPR